MKTIVCFGDSNTWGFNAVDGSRHPYPDRWTSVLQARLGDEFRVIPEGYNGRTTVFDDPVEGKIRNGKRYLPMVLGSHKPVDLVILMLGTNDLKKRFNQLPFDIAKGMQKLVEIAADPQFGPQQLPKVLIISPAQVLEVEGNREMFLDAARKSQQLASYYLQVAGEMGCYSLDAARHIESDPLDGIHLTAASQRTLGEAIYQKIIREIFPVN